LTEQFGKQYEEVEKAVLYKQRSLLAVLGSVVQA
jgi:hypothetical protein